MPYLLLIHEPRGQREARTPMRGEQAYADMLAWGQSLKARGLLLASESLKSDREGVRLAVRGGHRTLVDGPFAEAKEMIGGIFLIACATQKEALDIAAECPAAAFATVEVRETGPCFN